MRAAIVVLALSLLISISIWYKCVAKNRHMGHVDQYINAVSLGVLCYRLWAARMCLQLQHNRASSLLASQLKMLIVGGPETSCRKAQCASQNRIVKQSKCGEWLHLGLHICHRKLISAWCIQH